jgi:hypothetical protein
VILFLLFTNDVTICMKLDPGIHIGNTWFVLKTGCDMHNLMRTHGSEGATEPGRGGPRPVGPGRPAQPTSVAGSVSFSLHPKDLEP